MEYFEHVFGEDVLPFVGLLALVALGLGIAMVATGRGRFLIGIAALACVALLAIVTEWLWVTDRERVDGVVDSIALAATHEDSAGLMRHLAADCHYGSLDRTGIENLADSVFHQFMVDRVSISSRKTSVLRGRSEATAEFMAVVRGRSGNVEFSPYPTRWILTFVQREPHDWKVVEVQQISAFGESRQPLTPPGRGVLP